MDAEALYESDMLERSDMTTWVAVLTSWLSLDATQAFSKFVLGGHQLREGRRQVLDLLVELLLDCTQLLWAEAIQVHWGSYMSERKSSREMRLNSV